VGRINEVMKEQLRLMREKYKEAEKRDDELNFKAGEQFVFIDSYSVDTAKRGSNQGNPILIMPMKGAEKRNKKATHDLIFVLTDTEDRAGRFHRDKLKNFLKGFDIKSFDIYMLEETLEPLVNKVFKAKIDFDKNGFISVDPQRFAKENELEKAEPSQEEVPF